jgi:hypothetical protein
MMTTFLRQLARILAATEPVPYEFRAERMDQGWDKADAIWAATTLRR